MLIFGLGGAVQYEKTKLPEALSIHSEGQPLIGQGPIELVLFEDFLCSNCRIFSESVFPQIVNHFVLSGKSRLVLIPIAFSENSKPLANAAIAVYRTSPSRMLAFLLALFQSKATTKDEILEIAFEVGGIDEKYLTKALDSHLYYSELEGNLNLGRQLMGDQFGTPSLFINGVLTSTASFDAIVHRIHQIEMKK